MKQKLAIIGHGTVGRALCNQVARLPEFEIAGIAVKHPERHHDVNPNLLTTDAISLIELPDVGIILEAIDDAAASLNFALAALAQGKVYITASKKMVAENLALLYHTEQAHGGKLLCEAAVGGAIPILRTIREHLAGENITKVRGIINGSCNYILTRMATDGVAFDAALAEAQEKGFAESDPSSDVDGFDAYYKALILAHTWFGAIPEFGRVKFEGIREVALADVEAARDKGEKIKLIAEISREGHRFGIDIRPRQLSASDPLFNTDWEQNALLVEGEHTGPLFLQGAGAGGNPTASAMIGDLHNIGRRNIEALKKLILALN